MKSDKSRETFRPDKHYSSVRLQQGRVLTDADWNEQSDIIEYRNEITTQDVIGQSGVPMPPGGFDVGASTTDASDFTLSNGRIYVDGILAENNLPGTTYLTQPYPFFDVGAATGNFDPTNPPLPPAPQSSGVVVAYVDIWQRHIDVIDDPTIREIALGGPDTATRAQTVWQLKFLDIHNTDTVPGEPDNLPEFLALVNPTVPPAKLSAQAEGPPVSTDPCIIPQSAGFRLLENQLYRVEVHTGGSLSPDPGSSVFINQGDSTGSLEVTFKWSRDNGSVTAAWLPNPAQAAADTLTVQLFTTDETKGFSIGDWVELTDDSRDLSGVGGVFVKLTNVLGNTLTFDSTSVEDPINGNSPPVRGLDKNHPRVRRWDMMRPPIAVSRDDDANGGFVNLEAGVQVLFGAGTYKPGDYWEIPARTISGNVEWPQEADGVTPQPQPPFGITHHYACLTAFHQPNFTSKQDCRKLFLPLTMINPPTPDDDPTPGQFRYYLVDNVGGDDNVGKVGIDNESTTALGLAVSFQTLGKIFQIFPRDGHDSSAIILIKSTGQTYGDFSMSGVHGYKKIVIRGSSFDQINVDPEPRISGGQPISSFPSGLVVNNTSVRNQITFDAVLDGAPESHVGQRVRFSPTSPTLPNRCSMVLAHGSGQNGSSAGSFINLADDLSPDSAVRSDVVFLEDPGAILGEVQLGMTANDGVSLVGLNAQRITLSGIDTAEIAFCKAADFNIDTFGTIDMTQFFTDENGNSWNLGIGSNCAGAGISDGIAANIQSSAITSSFMSTIDRLSIDNGFFSSNLDITFCDAFTVGIGRTDNAAPYLARAGVGVTEFGGLNITASNGIIQGVQLENVFVNQTLDPVSFEDNSAISFEGVGKSLSIVDVIATNAGTAAGGPSGVILDSSGAIASTINYDPLFLPTPTVLSGVFRIPGLTMFRPFELSQTDVIDSADNHYFAPPRSFIQKGLALQLQSGNTQGITRYQVSQYVAQPGGGLSGQIQRAVCQLAPNAFIPNPDALAATIAGIAQQEILAADAGQSVSMHVTTGYSLVALDPNSPPPASFPAPVYLSAATNGTVTVTPPSSPNPVVRIGVMIRIIEYGDNAGYTRLAFVRLQLDQALNPPASTPTPPPPTGGT